MTRAGPRVTKHQRRPTARGRYRHIDAQHGSNKECLPISFGKTFECDKTLKCHSSILWCLHAFIEWMVGPQQCDTLHNLGRSFWVLASHNRSAERSSDGDQIEGGSCANHDDARDSHGIKSGEPYGLPFIVIIFVHSNGFCDNLWFRWCHIEGGLVPLQNEQDH